MYAANTETTKVISIFSNVKPILKNKENRITVPSESNLKELLDATWIQLQYYGLAARINNRFKTIKYSNLPGVYNQLGLIVHSKYYQVDLFDNDGLICGNNIYRDGSDGMPDIFHHSIKFNAFKVVNEIKINDEFNWIINPSDSNLPRHMRHQRYVEHDKKNVYLTEWR